MHWCLYLDNLFLFYGPNVFFFCVIKPSISLLRRLLSVCFTGIILYLTANIYFTDSFPFALLECGATEPLVLEASNQEECDQWIQVEFLSHFVRAEKTVVYTFLRFLQDNAFLV